MLIAQLIKSGMARQVISPLIPSPVAKCLEAAGHGKHLLCGEFVLPHEAYMLARSWAS